MLVLPFSDQMDRVFVCLRKASLDERLEKVARLIILEVIELRAGRWVPQDQACTYYTQKMAETEVSAKVYTVICVQTVICVCV